MDRTVTGRHWLLQGALVLGLLCINNHVSFAVPPSNPLATSGRETSVPATGPSIVPVTGEARASFRAPRVDGENAVVVLLADFPDLAWTTTPGDYTAVMNSVADFYAAQSGGQLTLVPTVASDGAGAPVVLRASQNVAYYGENDAGGKDSFPREFFSEIVLRADEQIADLDFADYDAVIVVHAGPGEDQEGVADDQLWSVRLALPSPVEVDGVMVTGGCIVPEYYNNDISVVGTIAHEFGHELGLPDLYDTATHIPVVGYWALMGGGNWVGAGASPAPMSAWSRIFLGWETPVILDSVGTTYNSDRFGTVDADIYQVYLHGVGDELEYFLIENRQATLGTLDEGLPGSGLLIWHVDMSAALEPEPTQPRYRRWERNTVNNGAVRMLSLEEADGDGNLLLPPANPDANRGEASDPFFSPDNIAFTDGSAPNSQDNDGQTSFVSLTEIPESGDSMSFLYGDNLKVVEAELVGDGTEVVVRFNKPVNGPSVLVGHFRLLHVTEDPGAAGIQPIGALITGDFTEIELTFSSAIDDSEVWALAMQGFSAVDGDPLYPTDPSCATLPCPAFVTNPFGTNVPGIVSGDAVWTEGGGPYYRARDAFVAYGVTLEIDPGTIIRVANTIGADDWPTAATDLVINGRILAQGTDESPILIESANRPGERAAGDWGTMVFPPQSNAEATFEHTEFRHGGYSLDALYVTRDNVSFVDSVFEDTSREVSVGPPRNLSAAVRIDSGVSALLQRCHFNSNVIAIRTSNSGLVELDELEITSSEYGVTLSGDSQVSVVRSEFRANSVAFQTNDTASLQLVQSFFDSNTVGVLLFNTSDLFASGNLFDGQISRVFQMTGAPTLNIVGNAFTGNTLVFGNFSTAAYAIDHNYYAGNTTRFSSGAGNPAVTTSYDLQHLIDYQFVPTSLTFRDATYTSDLDAIDVDDPLYIEVDGTGVSTVTNGAVVTVVSDLDPTGIVVHLVETGTSSNIYRVDDDPETQASAGATTSQSDYRIGASSSITASSPIPDEPSDTVEIDPAPVLTTDGDQFIQETETATINASCVDPEEQSVTLVVIEQPSGATFESGVWSWITDYTDAGTHTVTFQCDDGTHTVTESDSVVVSNLNRLPTLTTSGNQNVNELQTAEITATCEDLDLDDTLTFEVTTSPAGSTFAAGTWSWETGYDDAGTHTVTFRCFDGSDEVTDDDTVTVTNINRRPRIEPLGTIRASSNTTTTVDVVCTDPDGDDVTLSAVRLPGFAEFDSELARLTLTPSHADVGSWGDGEIRCSDPEPLTKTVNLTISVTRGNSTPIANAGRNLAVIAGDTFELDGSASYDPDEGDVLTYLWSQVDVDQPQIEIEQPTEPQTTATAPDVDWEMVAQLSLEVSDGTNVATDIAYVTIVDRNCSHPIAVSGDDQAVSVGADEAVTIYLDGRASYANDTSQLSYQWTQVDGATVNLQGPNSAVPSFDLTGPIGEEAYSFALVVRAVGGPCAGLESNPDQTTVLVLLDLDNAAPVADAGADAEGFSGEVLTLDGSASSDPDDEMVTYLWSQSSGSVAIMSQPATVAPTIELPWVSVTEELEFVLMVNDGFLNSMPDTVMVTVFPTDDLPDVVETEPDAGGPDVSPDAVESDVSETSDGTSDSAEQVEPAPLPIGELPPPTGCCALTIGPPNVSSKTLGLLILAAVWLGIRRRR